MDLIKLDKGTSNAHGIINENFNRVQNKERNVENGTVLEFPNGMAIVEYSYEISRGQDAYLPVPVDFEGDFSCFHNAVTSSGNDIFDARNFFPGTYEDESAGSTVRFQYQGTGVRGSGKLKIRITAIGKLKQEQ